MKGKFLKPVWAVLTGMLALFLAGCGADTEERLVQAIAEASNTKQPLNLQTVTDFEWDHVHIFPPYTSHEEINRTLGFEWTSDEYPQTAIDLSDRVNLIVFTHKKEVVESIEFLYEKGGIFTDDKIISVPKEKAVFQVKGYRIEWVKK